MNIYHKRFAIPSDSPFNEVVQMIPDSIPVDEYMSTIFEAIQFDGVFCENYLHLAIASLSHHLDLTKSWYVLTNETFTRARIKRFFNNPELCNRALIHKNETAMRWMTRSVLSVQTYLMCATWNDSVRALWLDSFEPIPSVFGNYTWSLTAPAYLEFMACDMPLNWSVLWQNRHTIFADYKLAEQQFLSLWATSLEGERCLRQFGVDLTQVDPREGHRILDRALFRLLRQRMLEICTALQSFRLPALVTCTILDHSWQRLAWMVPMHLKWKLTTGVKHFRSRQR